ncbi:MAG: DUF3108 domain-containing protein [Xanthomonadales bacterium]|nr:DUF3108 domain-containing protein [Xanthomonadales bacterium]
MKNRCFCKLMANWRPETIGLVALLLLGPLAGAAAAPAADEAAGSELHPYSARYSISRNGKLLGRAEVSLGREGDGWRIGSELKGTHGLARLLGVSDREQVSGRLRDGRFLPDNYQRHSRMAGIDKRWRATFDWDRGEVNIVHEDDEPQVLELIGDSLDPLSLKLEMRRRLGGPDPDLRFRMVEEDEIDEQNFRVLSNEWLETSLGCLETTPVEKIRRNSTRYTRAWHAPALGNVEVRMEHGKTDGVHVEMRITELKLGETEVLPRPNCSARQSAARMARGETAPGDN